MNGVIKIGIVGCGHVGMATASALFQAGTASEIILVDRNEQLAKGEAMDLMHGQGHAGRCKVRAGATKDLLGASYIVITAGVSQKAEETRIDLLNRNITILKSLIQDLDEFSPEAIIILATNPVDILTYACQKLSQRPWQKIIGTGTMLDTSRFRAILGEYYAVDPKSVHALVVGEHGDSEVLLWSSATIAGNRILNQYVLDQLISSEIMDKITVDVKNAAYQIIQKKGHTSWAIGLVISYLLKAIINDQKSIFPLSVRLEGEYGLENVCLGLPCVVAVTGVEKKVSLDLSAEELTALLSSAKKLQNLITQLDL